MNKILILNGPNLNMLGIREPEKYGNDSLEIIQQKVLKLANNEFEIIFFQTNSEEKMIDKIHDSYKDIDYFIFNPAAWTHTSIALRDAILSADIPFVEVHLSNIYKREKFRHKSYFSDIAQSVISGCGSQGYIFAVEYAKYKLNTNKG